MSDFNPKRLSASPYGDSAAAKPPTRANQAITWVVILAALSLVASLAAVALCGAAVVVKFTADFLTR